MDIREYRYILAVVQCGGISKAARKLYLSQPSLSAYIRNLEQRLGFSFFEDSARTTLTEEGRLYVDYASQIMTLNDNLYRQLEQMKEHKRRLVRMGITNTRSYLFLPRILPEVRKSCPHICLEVQEATSAELENSLLLKELDFGILNYPFKKEPLDFDTLCDEELVLVAPENDPVCALAVEKQEGCSYPWMDPRHLAGKPVIMLTQGQRIRQTADRILAQAGVVPQIVYETKNAMTAHRLTQSGLGLSFMIHSPQTDFLSEPVFSRGIRLFSLGSPHPALKLVIAYPAEKKRSKPAEEVIGLIRQILKDSGSDRIAPYSAER